MLKIRKSNERGATQLGWLDSKHTFSFGDYYDKDYMGFGSLRVINEDRVIPGAGFNSHPHRDMEIISYVLEGELQHKDSLGNGSIILPGEVQRMSAGTGIVHSEQNPQAAKPLHFIQIWIIPAKTGIAPSYEQKNFSEQRHAGKLTLAASADGRDGSLTIHQNAAMYILDLEQGQTFTYTLAAERLAWVQLARGSVLLNGQSLDAGDGAAVNNESLEFKATTKAEILIFDLNK